MKTQKRQDFSQITHKSLAFKSAFHKQLQANLHADELISTINYDFADMYIRRFLCLHQSVILILFDKI